MKHKNEQYNDTQVRIIFVEKSLKILISVLVSVFLVFEIHGSTIQEYLFCCERTQETSSENHRECSVEENHGRIGKQVISPLTRQSKISTKNPLNSFNAVYSQVLASSQLYQLDKSRSIPAVPIAAFSVLRV